MNETGATRDAAAPMTDEERNLARHALGLPNRHRSSYRNHFVAATHEGWERLVSAGLARVRRSVEPNGMHTYRLTRAGAEAALDPGERLDPEDFPT